MVTSPARWWSRSSPRLAADYDPARGAEHVADAFARAQARIVGYGEAHRAVTPGWHAGTTAVVAVLVDDNGVTKWLLANLGDSRIYRITEGRLEQVSVDHSVVQELIDSGEITHDQAAVHPERHVITRALGSPEGIAPDFFLLPLGSVERLLLCSDGVTGMIEDKEIEDILETVARPARRGRPARARRRRGRRPGQRDGDRRGCGGIGARRQL